MFQQQFNRRTVLRGMGALIAMPWLESLTGAGPRLFGADASRKAPGPLRAMFVYVPNGMVMEQWTATERPAGLELADSLSPLAPLQDELVVVSGLAHRYGEANGDGPGDHARASASFLTAAQPRKTASVDIRAGVSIDQALAARLGKSTRLSSLELGCDKGQQAGACDSGYSCAYQFNLSWKTPTLPLPPEVDPRSVFERLFSPVAGPGDEAARQERIAQRKSVLDYVQGEAQRLKRDLSGADVRKFDEFVESVRDVEQRIERSAGEVAKAAPEADRLNLAPDSYQAHIRVMFDLAALAFQTDTTRVITFMVAHDGSNRSYPFLGVPDGHHDLSHHGGNVEKKAKIAKINRFHVEQFAWFLGKLREMREGEGNLLDHSLIVYGSGLSDGDAHDHHNLPIVLAGKARGALRTGRRLAVADRTPMANLFLSMLDMAAVAETGADDGAREGNGAQEVDTAQGAVDRFGDSSGRLEGLA